MENITLQKAIQSLSGKRAADAVENLALFNGDHLHLGRAGQSFDGYIGIIPPVGSKTYEFTTAWLQRIFTASNLVKAAVNRNLDACLTREADWALQFLGDVSDDQKDLLTKETTTAVIDWWNENDIQKNVLRAAGKAALLEEELFLRPVITRQERNSDGRLPFKKTLSDAFDLIEFEIVTADQGALFRDAETGRKSSICYIKTDKGQQVEYSYIGDDGLTYLTILNDQDLKQWANSQNLQQLAKYIERTPEINKAEGIDLGGRLFLHRITREKLITEPARSLQRSVNYALTTMNKNLNIAGSRETSYGNTQRPKKRVETKDGTGKVISVTEEDAPLVKGVDNANFLIGIPIYSDTLKDAQGNPVLVDYKQPQQFVVDPVAVDTFVKAFEVYRELFLEEVGQAHILTGSLTVSGKSKQETRSEFGKTVNATVFAINPAGRYMLDVLLKMGAKLCNRSAEFSLTRFEFKCQTTIGAVDLEEIKQEAQDVKDGFSTLYLLAVKKGIEDPDAFIEQLKSADDYVLSQLEKALKMNVENPAIPLAVLIDYLPIGDEDKQKLKDSIVKSNVENKGQGNN